MYLQRVVGRWHRLRSGPAAENALQRFLGQLPNLLVESVATQWITGPVVRLQLPRV